MDSIAPTGVNVTKHITTSPRSIAPNSSTRKRRVTEPLPIGPFGRSPFEAEPTVAMRFRGRGFSASLNPAKKLEILGRGKSPLDVDIHIPSPFVRPRHAIVHHELGLQSSVLYIEPADGDCVVRRLSGHFAESITRRTPVYRADRILLGDVELMCLGRSAFGLEHPLARYCLRDAHASVDVLLEAAEQFGPLVLEGSTLVAHAVAELLHRGTQKRHHPLFVPGRLGGRERDIDALLREADCGTVFIREHILKEAPDEFFSALLDRNEYHLWPIFVVESAMALWDRLSRSTISRRDSVRCVRVVEPVS